MNNFKINDKNIGKGSPALIIAEVGVNHNGLLERGYQLIDSAKRAGADIVKFQTYKASQITTKTAPRYWDDNLNDDQSSGTQFDTFSKLDSFGIKEYNDLKDYCKKREIIFCSTPFNLPDVDVLEKIGVEVYKISSSDITYTELVDKIASTKKPIILSTGCSSLSEISKAVEIILSQGNNKLILQHCILQYPCDDENANLDKMKKIQSFFPNIPVGYSDHTIGIDIPIYSVAMGAYSVEKHFTIDKKLPDSPDHKLSVNEEELKEMVQKIRKVEIAKGKFIDGYYPSEKKAYKYARKSLVASKNINAGQKITYGMITAKRPGTGINPSKINKVVGSIANRNISEDEIITLDMLNV